MAYTYTKIADASEAIHCRSFAVGDVIQYAGNDYIWKKVIADDYPSTTATMNYLLSYGHITHIDGSTTQIDTLAPYATYLRSGTASTTLTDKTKSFAVGVMSTINAIITKVNSLTGRVTAVETLAASKAAIDDTALASTSTTLSASKIVALNATVLSDANSFATNAANEAKAAAISQLAGVDGTQLQALNDLQAALQANSDADGVIATDLLNKIDYSKSQTLTDAQAAQARANIKFDSAVAAAMLVTVGDVSLFDPDAILATALTLN